MQPYVSHITDYDDDSRAWCTNSQGKAGDGVGGGGQLVLYDQLQHAALIGWNTVMWHLP